MAEGLVFQGTTITIEVSNVATDMGELISLNLPEFDTDDIDMTHSMSSGNLREFKAGLSDGGEVEADYARALAMRGVDTEFVITLEDGSTSTFDGYVKNVGGEGSVGEKISATVTIKVSGLPVFDPA
jgi:hypothetical protein